MFCWNGTFCPLKISLMTVWYIQLSDFFNVRMVCLLACEKPMGGDWYLASIITSDQYLMHRLPLAMQRKPAPSCVIPHHPRWGWGEDTAGGLRFLCQGARARSLFKSTQPRGRENASLSLHSDLHQSISRVLCPRTCYVPALLKIISLWFFFSCCF